MLVRRSDASGEVAIARCRDCTNLGRLPRERARKLARPGVPRVSAVEFGSRESAPLVSCDPKMDSPPPPPPCYKTLALGCVGTAAAEVPLWQLLTTMPGLLC
jgi:hypothetical protein